MFSNLDIGFLFSFAVMESNMVREYAEGWIVALSYVLFLSTIKTGFKNIKITKRIALSAGFLLFFSVCGLFVIFNLQDTFKWICTKQLLLLSYFFVCVAMLWVLSYYTSLHLAPSVPSLP